MNNRKLLAIAVGTSTAFGAMNTSALQIEEVVVTAQKKEQSINDVGMAITAFSGDVMNELGVKDTTDMAALTPGLTFTETSFGPPVYTMRGIGYRDTSYNAASTVGVYVDEAGIPYPIMTLGAVMDLERVEVLKGPQGTLYGRNNTGGAINYIASKPTEELEAGIITSYGRYDTFDVEGYVSGPLSDTIGARLAIKTTQSGEGWQKNEINNEKLGEEDKTALRLSFAANLSDNLDALLQIGWWNNKSDSQAPQTTGPDFHGSGFWANTLEPWRQAFAPSGNEENDIASWTPQQNLENDMEGSSVTFRFNYAINDTLSLTSVSNVSDFEDDGGRRDVGGFAVPYSEVAAYMEMEDFFNINGGQPISLGDESEWSWVPAFLITNDATIDSFSQEFRLAGEHDSMNWILGVYYADDEVESLVDQYVPISSNTNAGPGRSFAGGTQFGVSETESLGVFVHTEWSLSEALRLTVGLRYSDDTNDYKGCVLDSLNGATATFFTRFIGAGDLEPGTCQTQFFDNSGNPTGEVGLVSDSLEEDSVSGRVNLDWFVNSDLMAYFSYSRGFKAGSFPNLVATSSVQYTPVTQEQVDAVEVGFKATLFDGAMQFNGSVFYNDYQDKQLMTTVIDPVFGAFRRLTNISESEILGAEVDIQWQPIDGLYTTLSASYLDAEVKGDFLGADPQGRIINFGGSKFPNTADLQLTALVNYEWSLNDNLNAFVGFDVSYTDDMVTTYEPGRIIPGVDPSGDTDIPDTHVIDSYTLVNARIGLASHDEKWRVMLWSRNLTDEYYTSRADSTIDSAVVYTGRPVTYGVTFEYSWF